MALAHTLQKVSHDHILFRSSNVAPLGTVMSYNLSNAGFVEKISGSPDSVLTIVAGIAMQNVVNRSVPSNLIAPGASGAPDILGDDTGSITLPRNHNKNETYVSGVMRLLVRGYMETDQIDTTATFGQGSGIYIGDDGLVTTVDGSISGVGANKLIGHAMTSVRDGHVRIFVNI